MKCDIRPRGCNYFSCSTQLRNKFQMVMNTKMLKNIKTFPTFTHSDVVFIMLRNVKMPLIADILTFMSMIIFMLS